MRFFRLLAIILLFLLGTSAVVGAIPLILSPQQQPWQMPQNLLEHSPFRSFLVPGIILLLANGLLCLYILAITVIRRPGYGWWVAAQGCVLLGWLIVECILIRLVIWPHYFYGVIGVILVAAGLVLRDDARPALV
jgi:uncharacterized BrkB/YihY/UPF0761 family membrane protein